MRFVDSNIPIYAASLVLGEREKQRIAARLLTAPNLAMSVQVLSEFYAQATSRRRRRPLSHERAAQIIERLQSLHHIEPLTSETVDKALDYRARYQVSYWDGLILAAASISGCEAVYSEDLNHGQVYDGMEMINPFLQY